MRLKRPSLPKHRRRTGTICATAEYSLYSGDQHVDPGWTETRQIEPKKRAKDFEIDDSDKRPLSFAGQSSECLQSNFGNKAQLTELTGGVRRNRA